MPGACPYLTVVEYAHAGRAARVERGETGWLVYCTSETEPAWRAERPSGLKARQVAREWVDGRRMGPTQWRLRRR